jgi:hypothetical protein
MAGNTIRLYLRRNNEKGERNYFDYINNYFLDQGRLTAYTG